MLSYSLAILGVVVTAAFLFVVIAGVVKDTRIRRQVEDLFGQALDVSEQGAYEAALSLAVQSSHLAREYAGESDPLFVETLFARALIHALKGDAVSAEALLLWGLAILRRREHEDSDLVSQRKWLSRGTGEYVANSDLVCRLLICLALLYEQAGDTAAAEPLRERSQRIAEWRAARGTVAHSPMDQALHSVRALLVMAWKGHLFQADVRPAPSLPPDSVECMVFASPTVEPGETLFVQVFVLLPEQAAAAEAQAKQFDDAAEQRAAKTLEAAIPRGARVTFHLAVRGLEPDDAIQSLVWRGEPQAVQFGVPVPPDCPRGTYIGTVTVSLDSIPIGHIKFKIVVAAAVQEEGPAPFGKEPVGTSARQYRKAFISYASKDRTEVLKRVQMLSHFRIDYFQDLLDLEPGERWEKALYRHIDTSDLFLLFWSSAARDSKWVAQEWRYALERKGGDDCAPPEIHPVILEGPPPPDPPPELSHLHFNDYLRYFMEGG